MEGKNKVTQSSIRERNTLSIKENAEVKEIIENKIEEIELKEKCS